MSFQKNILTTKEKINFLKAIQEHNTDRLEQINSKICDSVDLEMHVILQIGIAMNHYLKSLIEPLETFNIIGANVLFRTLVESFINIEYIMKDESRERSLPYIREDFKIRRINVETIKNLILTKPSEAEFIPKLSTIEKCDEQLEKIKNERIEKLSTLREDFGVEIEETELNFGKIEQRAKKAGLKDIYNILYRQLCLIAHLSSSGLKNLIKCDKNKYIIIPKDIKEETKKIIPIVYDIFLITIEDLLKKFSLYIEEDFKEMETISEKLKI